MSRFPRLWALAPLTVLLATTLAAPADAAAPKRAALTRWSSTTELAGGSTASAKVTGGSVVMTGGTSATWTSPWSTNSFGAGTTLIPSWDATTPAGSHLVIEARVRSGSTIGSWDTVATWASGTDRVKRASGSSQTDDLSRLSTDTVMASSGKSFTGWQARVTLKRASSKGATPTLHEVNGVVANFATRSLATTKTTMTKTIDLAVPTSSQMVHRGHFPQWGNGGEAWCSPTSVSMVLRYFKTGPVASTYAFMKDSRGYVDYAARETYDHAYRGTGNWSFNTAYAGRYSVDAFVTRLYYLREAEAFIKAGIPLVVGVAFGKGGLSGAPISSTPGHLMVIRGFTKSGSVIVNDPAGSSDGAVKRTYSRSQFEKAWLQGSGGMAYVIRPTSRALPADSPRW